MSSGGSRSHQRYKTSVIQLPATAAVMKKIPEEAKKTSKDMPQSPEVESRILVHSVLDVQQSHRLLPGYTEPWRGFGDVSRSSVVDYCHPAFLCKLGTADIYENVTLFLHAFLI